jgi:hypothetical protein
LTWLGACGTRIEMRFWTCQLCVALAAVTAVAMLGPGCDPAPTLAICAGAIPPPTCFDTGTDTGAGCETADDCQGFACCEGVCSESASCSVVDAGVDSPADGDVSDAPLDAPEG